MQIKFLFDIEDATDADLHRLAVDAIKLMGGVYGDEYGSAVMLEVMAELTFRSKCRLHGGHIPSVRRFQ